MLRLLTILLALVPLTLSAQSEPLDNNAPWTPILATFSLTQAGALPACTAADDCFMRCFVSGSAWVCEKSDGTSVAVTNGAAGGVVDCLGVTNGCVKVSAVGEAPSIAAATAVTAGINTLWISPHTLRIVGFTDGTGHANPRWFNHGELNVGGIQVYNVSTTQTNCGWNESGSTVAPNNSSGGNSQYQITTCKQTGDTDRHVTINGNVGSIAVTDVTVVAPSSDNVYFGNYRGSSNPMNGYLRAVYFYDVAKSAASDSDFERTIYGTAAQAVVTEVRDTTRPCAHGTGASLTYDVPGPDFPCVDPDNGLFVSEETTNYAKRSITLDAMATTGTVTVTADQDSGPFAIYNVGAEVDEIDSTAADLGCVETASAGVADGTYTCSVWLATADQTGYTIEIFKDGTGLGTAKTADDLTATYVRLETSEATGGAASTDITCRVCSGDAAADTGAILAVGLQLENSAYSTPFCLSTGATTTCNADSASVSTTGWPTAQGSISMTFSPWLSDTPGSLYVFDYWTSGVGGLVFHLTNGEALTMTTADAGATDAFASAALTWTPETNYRLQAVWGAGIAQSFRDGVLLATSTTAKIPLAGPASAYLLSSNGTNLYINGWIKNLEVRR